MRRVRSQKAIIIIIIIIISSSSSSSSSSSICRICKVANSNIL
jgi:hypothetical protein